MSVSIFRLPPELIELVIRNNEKYQITLRACALVCRAFRHPAQRCIFTTIMLAPAPNPGPAPRLLALLRASPHLAAHVRDFSIVEVGSGSEWDAWYPSLVALLELLNFVKTFSLGFASPRLQWRHLPADLQTAICAFCARSALVSLTLSHGGGLNSLAEFSQLVASTALKSLWLKGVSIPPASSANASGSLIPPTNAVALTHFQFDLDAPTLSIVTPWLADHGSLSKLQSIAFACTRETASHLRALTTGAPDVETVILDLQNVAFTIDFPPLRFGGALPRLHKITMSLEIDVNHSDQLPRGLAVLLDSCSSGLKKLNIMIYPSSRDQQLPVVDLDWAPVAEVVTLARFPVLERLSFVFWPAYNVPESVFAKLMADMRSGLPDLHARGMLKAAGLHDTIAMPDALLH
ncbi:hypothetical protein C8R46DRAFT_1360530 [Mycena filopes]|nr:hypothetical protein C8R46DRAFT_1360530 [Mycena filopes]